MGERDPFELAEAQEREADDLDRRGQEVERSVRETREDWERKRADDAVPGANPPDDEDEDSGEEERRSPAPQAPPPSAGPGDAETPPEGGAGPPADAVDDD